MEWIESMRVGVVIQIALYFNKFCNIFIHLAESLRF